MKPIKEYLLEYVSSGTKSIKHGSYNTVETKDELIGMLTSLGVDGQEVAAKDSVLLDFNPPKNLMWEVIGPYPNSQGYIFRMKNTHNQCISFFIDASGKIVTDRNITLLLKENTSNSGKWNGVEVELDLYGALDMIDMMASAPDKKLTKRDIKI